MKSLKALKQNNKGAGIVTVVVVLSFLTTIGLLIMAISYTSSEMRASERWGREVAYNANGVVEQMRSGAELAVSDSIKACYTKVMTNYSAYRDTIEDEFDREFNKSLNTWKPYKFEANEADPSEPLTVYYTGEKDENGKMLTTVDKTSALNLLAGNVQNYDTIGSESFWVHKSYNVRALEAFVKAGFGGTATVNCLVNGNIVENGMGVAEWEWKNGGSEPAAGGDTPSRVILKDVVVDYSRLMRTVRITTDIVIDFPDLGYVYNEETPSSKFTEFAIVALNSIEHMTGYVDIKGKAYTGKLDITGASQAHQLQLNTGGLLICNGDINVNGNNISNAAGTDSLVARSAFLVDDTSTLWAKNINVKQNGIAALCYRANILNDLNLSASGASAYIGGEYFGFGASETNPAQSSAINVQGFKNGDDQSNTVLQLDGANVTLAGFSFINTDEQGIAGYRTGQSMAVGEDQVAYLVPVEMLNYAIDETWVQKINTNPEILSNDLNGVMAADKYEVILAQLNNKNNKPIQNTLWTVSGTAMKPDDYGITVRPVKVSPPHIPGLIVYFFMEFNATSERTAIENRNQFFRDYFQNHPERVRNYLEQYMSLTDTSNYFGSVGNTYTIDKDSNKVVLRALSSIINVDSIMSTVNKKLNAFANLCITLNEGFGPEHALEDDLGTDEEKEARSHVNNPFNYYVKEDLVNAALDKMPASDKTIRFYNSQGLVAVITSQKFEYNKDAYPYLCLIISTSATGDKDVVIKSDFTGLIMCKGEVYVESPADMSKKVTLTADSEAVNEAMGAATLGQYNRSYFGFDPIEGNDTNFIMPYEFLYYKYTPNQSEFDIDEGSYWDVGTLVYFDRWKKG